MNMAKPIIVLTVICIVASALLGLTYNVTKDQIAAVQKAASDAAMIEVLPGAATFSEYDAAQIGNDAILLAAKEESGLGYVFKVQDKGFGGAYVIMVGIAPDGTVTGAKLLDNAETPGLGSKTGEADFTSRFTGVDEAGLPEVQTITGATISSSAFKRCVETAFKTYNQVKEGA